jgi:hypothetical protein
MGLWSSVVYDSFGDETYRDIKKSGDNVWGHIVWGQNVGGCDIWGQTTHQEGHSICRCHNQSLQPLSEKELKGTVSQDFFTMVFSSNIFS